MPQRSYPYACARLSALEKDLLTASQVKRMAESTLEDVMRQLLELRYGNLPDAQPTDIERMTDNMRIAAAETVRELSPEPRLTDLFLIRTDVQNLKLLIKARLLHQPDAVLAAGGLYDRDTLNRMVSEQDYRELPERIAAALDRLETKLRITVEPQLVSIALDYGYLDHALSTARELKDPFAEQYFSALADFDNVLTFLRMRAMGASKEDMKEAVLPEGGISRRVLLDAYEFTADVLAKALNGSVARREMADGLNEMVVTGSIGTLEKARDNYLLSLVNAHRHDRMTIFPVIGYLIARDREAKAVRLIVTAKRNGLDEGVITERLRELYG